VTEERETSEEAAAMGVVGVMFGPSQLIVAVAEKSETTQLYKYCPVLSCGYQDGACLVLLENLPPHIMMRFLLQNT
jgi:hypothetical protein